MYSNYNLDYLAALYKKYLYQIRHQITQYNK